MVTISPTLFLHNTNVIRIANEFIELLVSIDFGPRVLFFGALRGVNQFYLQPQDLLNSQPDQFHFFGGHRLWAAPEDPIKTYIPDNEPVEWHQQENTVIIHQPACGKQLLAKTLSLVMDPLLPQVTITHILTNASKQVLNFAPWALTQMAPGGMAIMPLPPRGKHSENLLPTASLVLWPYTDLSDPRLRWGYEYIRAQQNPQRAQSLKFGMASNLGWLAYANQNQLFLKQSRVATGKPYPDRGTAIQVFMDDAMLELETLGPLADVYPGQALEHIETWHLIDSVQPPQDDAAVHLLIDSFIK